MDKQKASLRELSAMTGIPLWTLRHKASRRAFTIYKLGRKIYVDLKEFQNWWNEHRMEPKNGGVKWHIKKTA